MHKNVGQHQHTYFITNNERNLHDIEIKTRSRQAVMMGFKWFQSASTSMEVSYRAVIYNDFWSKYND